jgi:hypothetical protein
VLSCILEQSFGQCSSDMCFIYTVRRSEKLGGLSVRALQRLLEHDGRGSVVFDMPVFDGRRLGDRGMDVLRVQPLQEFLSTRTNSSSLAKLHLQYIN